MNLELVYLVNCFFLYHQLKSKKCGKSLIIFGRLMLKLRKCSLQILINLYRSITFRGSRPDMSSKKGVLTSFTKFTGKHLCQSLFFNKNAVLSPATLLKKKLWHRCFPANSVKFIKTPFYKEHLLWLFLILLN